MNITERAAQVLQEIDEQLAICEKATARPWEHHKTGYAVHGFDGGFICKTEYADADAAKRRQENAAFIAAARTVCPKSLRCLKTAIEGQLKRYLSNRRFGEDTALPSWQDLTALITQWNSK
tara:strand:+ start:1084 stop:1446 length:363 start_codon:yes stop_codon:yes gene_type:complete